MAFLIFGTLSTLVFGVGPGVASGVLETHGHERIAEILQTLEYCSWWGLAWTGSSIAVYYGHKLTMILRNHINATEAKLGLPAKSLGIQDLRSPSPMRYLRVMIQITAYGASAIYLAAGSLSGLWALYRGDIMRAKNQRLAHIMGPFLTCAFAAPLMVKLILVTFYIRYSKRENVLDQSSSCISPGHGAVSEDQRATKAASPRVPSDHYRTREESSLDQTLQLIETDSQICGLHSKPRQSNITEVERKM
ncbi:hypothetical protein EC968_003988 [Mortierella alpina]|nr:hypothetical protein EC968_003988 [Mortierella alpina]